MSKQSVTVTNKNSLLHLSEESGAPTRIVGPALGALAAGLSALTYYRYRRDISAARARISSGSQMVHTPCGSIEYAVAGNGPPILVIHGAGGGFDQGLQFTRPLINTGFKVIAVSRFGYLRTPLPSDASPIIQANAHAYLLDALKLAKHT